ncbi:MAG: hypothetical protein P1U40_03215 [Coxiellaceae bacterium]|nr:hypothetical protein [Coxiellaceae bacterium]
MRQLSITLLIGCIYSIGFAAVDSISIPLSSDLTRPASAKAFYSALKSYGSNPLNGVQCAKVPPYQIDACLPLSVKNNNPNTKHNYTVMARLAWHNFVALNWPSAYRGQANQKKHFGKGPRVWETEHHRIELYAGKMTSPTTTIAIGPTGPINKNIPLTKRPIYTYPNPLANKSQKIIHACKGKDTPASQTPWHNLDENSQIGVVYIAANKPRGTPKPILFEAKFNNTEYHYVVNRQLYNHTTLTPYRLGNQALIQGKYPASQKVLFFPAGTMENKSSWRKLTPAEIQTNQFYMARVRYYALSKAKIPQVCYIDTDDPKAVHAMRKRIARIRNAKKRRIAENRAYGKKNIWGMLGWHIILKPYFIAKNGEKLPYPYFVFSTFEQKNNYKQASEGGAINVPSISIPHPIMPLAKKPAHNAVSLLTKPSLQAENPDGCPISSTHSPFLMSYVQNIPSNLNKQLAGTSVPVCVKRRRYALSPVLHPGGVLDKYRPTLLNNTVWQNYFLTDVQWVPRNPSRHYSAKNEKHAYAPVKQFASSYYTANGTIETPLIMSNFRGNIFQFPSGTPQFSYYNRIADYKFSPYNSLVYNIQTFGKNFQFDSPLPPSKASPHGAAGRFNMGGCMGCHGMAQRYGTDFSLILADGPFTHPDVMDVVATAFTSESLDTTSMVMQMQKRVKTEPAYQQAVAYEIQLDRNMRRHLDGERVN